MSAFLRSASRAPVTFLALCLGALLTSSNAAFIEFDNCLSSAFLANSPPLVQWVPLLFDARFTDTGATRPMNITLYGNVTGQQTTMAYPPPNASIWSNSSERYGKITRTNADGTGLTAQDTKFTFLDYVAYTAPRIAFCDENQTFVNGDACPLGPLFYKNASDPRDLHGFRVQQNFNSSYAFTTLTATVTILTGDSSPQLIGCISANITPDIGSGIRALLTWLPAAILTLKAIATLAAAIYSPWGSADIFRWSSNYGRDEDLLRLVTPGFGDCLQYIQFILLTGSLSLQYPGFFQPAVRQTAWSCLLFNESFVSHGSGTQSLIDGIYATSGSYGLQRMSQLIGMTDIDDIWACMAIWLAVIAGIVILLCQLGFASRWIYRLITDTTEEDLRSKNLPFTLGNLVRLMFNYFILPIVALSFFQLVISANSPIVVVVMAAILLVIMILAAGWILRFIFSTKPRTFLFDDMPTVLLYGPFYNTYSDSAAPFALVPVFITFMRGVAIGAVQPSGIAQIVILAICEVILILTLNGLRPFQGQTSMNLYHTVFSAVRLSTVLLQIAFVPRLGVTEGPKGWVGYVILILHACVLVFGFFLNAAQTLLEVIARGFGVGGHSQDAVRGSILTVRMLKKRRNRPPTSDRQSLMSTTAMLRHNDEFDPARSRSMSASSQQLLNRSGHRTPSISRLSGFENFSSAGDLVTPGVDAESTAYFGAAGNPVSKKSPDLTGAVDNFYRPPRQRRNTGDLITPGAKSRQSAVVNDFPYSDSPGRLGKPSVSYGSSYGRDSPAAAYMRERADSDAEHGPRTDYAVREVDQYYRGEPLAGGPARKLKTGPADPQGPAANAQSWLQRMLFGIQGKSKQDKEKSKGFEVVRSTRLPPEMQQGADAQEGYEMVNSPSMPSEPYTDSPASHDIEAQAVAGAQRHSGHKSSASGSRSSAFDFGFDDPAVAAQRDSSRPEIQDLLGAHAGQRPSSDSLRNQHPGLRAEMAPQSANRRSLQAPAQTSHHIAEVPSLSPIESVGGIDFPSRFNSRASTVDPGRDWLNAVDNLDWPDHSREPASHPGISAYVAPNVPERSTRRPISEAFSPPQGLPTRNFTAFQDDAPSPRDPHPPDEVERPTSFAVSHRRAADSITRNSFGAGQIASAAEVLDHDGK